MKRFLIILITGFILFSCAKAQPKLELKPELIEFEDTFHRLKNVYFINSGDQPLVIDTIYYRSDLYLVRFNKYWHYPVTIQPGDSLVMDCILSGYNFVALNDTADAMVVRSNSGNGTDQIKVKIDFHNKKKYGTIEGQVTDGDEGVNKARVNFLYEGKYIISSTETNGDGHYEAELPPGRYSVAAFSDSFYTAFSGQKSEPFNARLVILDEEETETVDISLIRVKPGGFIISGNVIDSLSSTSLRKAVIIIKKGGHTPRKPDITNLNEDEAYTFFAGPDGSFRANVANPDYYYVQAFSDYFLPAYYTTESSSSVLWQTADTLFINSDMENKNIYLPRDSSYGAGIIEGKIVLNGIASDSLSDIIIFAQSLENDNLYSYTFSESEGTFKFTHLPYGRYKLFAQKIGYKNFYSDSVEITPSSPTVSDVQIVLTVSSVDVEDFVPQDITLYPNYPNPFNPSTTIEFSLKQGIKVRLSLVSVLGEEIKVLHSGFLYSGKYSYSLDAGNLSSGAYFILLEAGSYTKVQKVLLLK